MRGVVLAFLCGAAAFTPSVAPRRAARAISAAPPDVETINGVSAKVNGVALDTLDRLREKVDEPEAVDEQLAELEAIAERANAARASLLSARGDATQLQNEMRAAKEEAARLAEENESLKKRLAVLDAARIAYAATTTSIDMSSGPTAAETLAAAAAPVNGAPVVLTGSTKKGMKAKVRKLAATESSEPPKPASKAAAKLAKLGIEELE